MPAPPDAGTTHRSRSDGRGAAGAYGRLPTSVRTRSKRTRSGRVGVLRSRRGQMLSRRVRLITALFLPIVLVAALVSVVSGTAGARRASLAGVPRASLAGVPRASSVGASKPYTAKLSYDESNHGHQHGQATVGIVGHGAFSAKLGPGAALDAALIAQIGRA